MLKKTKPLNLFLFKRTLIFQIYLILSFPLGCWANSKSVVPIKHSSIPLIATKNLGTIIFYIAIYFIITYFSLLAGSFAIRRRIIIKSWSFLKYILFASLGGLIVEVFAWIFTPNVLNVYLELKISTGILFLTTVPIVFLSLILYNYWLSQKIFNLTKKQSIIMGAMMGIIPSAYPAIYLFPLVIIK